MSSGLRILSVILEMLTLRIWDPSPPYPSMCVCVYYVCICVRSVMYVPQDLQNRFSWLIYPADFRLAGPKASGESSVFTSVSTVTLGL